MGLNVDIGVGTMIGRFVRSVVTPSLNMLQLARTAGMRKLHSDIIELAKGRFWPSLRVGY